ncbi:hypothetical protein ACPXCE_28020 [Streptomyces sp. DT24]|uniref:hypothetical protein n=1 Tax=unclassified Streptomyces TaxID=2593676 RepID=UPI0023B9E7AE|nr:hypothetical protein [Streptomyces sp. AM 4-1-1]WEH35896.1 hypothetical protein PZB75_22600 [Streptomyces sp. AM 4-1-1]
MSAPTPAGPETPGPGIQPPAFGQPPPELLARANRGYARFFAVQTPDADTGNHDQDENAAGA